MKPSKNLDKQIREILDEYMPDGWNGNMLEELEEFIEQRERETMEKFGIKKGVEYKVYGSDKVIVLEALQKGKS